MSNTDPHRRLRPVIVVVDEVWEFMTAAGPVDAAAVDALAELIRRKTAELAAAAARCGDHQRQDGRDERKETGR